MEEVEGKYFYFHPGIGLDLGFNFGSKIVGRERYSNVGLGSSLRGEPGLTTFRSQGCP